MTSLVEHQKNRLFKAMIIGATGGGKTGSLVEVIRNRKELGIDHILIHDWDDGLGILSQLLSRSDAEAVHFKTLRDELKATPKGPVVKGEPKAYATGLALMNNWKMKDEDFGSCSTWGSNILFVGDSLTGLGDACMRWSRYTQNANVEDSDWQFTALAMRAQDQYVQLLLALNCHCILTSHIRYMGGGGYKIVEDKHGSKYKTDVHSITEGTAYPSALGQQLPPQIARHFDYLLEAKLDGKSRKLLTQPEINVPLKAPLPTNFPGRLPVETGLYQVMKQALSHETEGKNQ